MHFVSALPELRLQRGQACLVMALNERGDFELQAGSSWADAARLMAAQLSGPAECDAVLATVGKRHGWRVATPTRQVLEARAVLAFSLVQGFPPEWVDDVRAFVDAWQHFWPMRFWEQCAPELALPILRRKRGKTRTHGVSFMGRSGLEYGFAFYQDLESFDALWSGERPNITGYSVLAADEDDPLHEAFATFDSPAPVLSCLKSTQLRPSTQRDVIEATAVMNLLLGLMQGRTDAIEVGPGETLELKQTPKASAKKKKVRKR